MPADDFHDKPFDEGTLTKLRIFELYAREWLPVFLSQRHPIHTEIHLFDFFAGPGVDGRGEFGSPLRLLRQLRDYQSMAGWPNVRTTVHFFDSDAEKIEKLTRNIDSNNLRLPGVTIDPRRLAFPDAFNESREILAVQYSAKLVFIDQFGVDHVTPLRSGAIHDEADVIRVCFEHGVKRQHAESALRRLKDDGVIALEFRVPDIRRVGSPRPIRCVP